MFSKDSIFSRDLNQKETHFRVSLTNGKVNIESRIVPFSCKEFPFKSIKCQTKFTNFVPYN